VNKISKKFTMRRKLKS